MKLRYKYAAISEKDLVCKIGKEFEMIEKLGSKLGKTAKEMLSLIIEF